MTTTPNPTPTSQILDAAADLIEKRGWVTGNGWETPARALSGASLCLEGGIMAALGLRLDCSSAEGASLLPLWTCPAYRAVADYLDRDVTIQERPMVGPGPAQALYWWNDLQDTAEQVIEVLRATALLEAAREEAATQAPADRHEVAL